MFHGKGLLRKPNGEIYEGEFYYSYFKEGKVTTRRYVGTMKNNKYHGKGKLILWDTFATYEGDFENHVFSGHGVYTYQNGARYEGKFVNNLRDGAGVYYFPDGSKYEGTFAQDKFTGKGAYTYKNGKKIAGEFVDDLFLTEGLKKDANSTLSGNGLKIN